MFEWLEGVEECVTNAKCLVGDPTFTIENTLMLVTIISYDLYSCMDISPQWKTVYDDWGGEARLASSCELWYLWYTYQFQSPITFLMITLWLWYIMFQSY